MEEDLGMCSEVFDTGVLIPGHGRRFWLARGAAGNLQRFSAFKYVLFSSSTVQ